jgi:D-serine deaminase-like pyridoxal phosphate-dependent protein
MNGITGTDYPAVLMERPSLENLETPAALVDLKRVEANLRRVSGSGPCAMAPCKEPGLSRAAGGEPHE